MQDGGKIDRRRSRPASPPLISSSLAITQQLQMDPGSGGSGWMLASVYLHPWVTAGVHDAAWLSLFSTWLWQKGFSQQRTECLRLFLFQSVKLEMFYWDMLLLWLFILLLWFLEIKLHLLQLWTSVPTFIPLPLESKFSESARSLLAIRPKDI